MTVTTQTRPMPLTKAQRVVLTAAAARPDATLTPPARLKGGAAQNLAQALIGKALAREVRTRGELPVWRKEADTGRDFSLVLTKAGRALVAAPDDSAAPATAATVAVAAATAATAADAPAAPREAAPLAAPSPAAPRAGSKLAAVLALLSRQQGSSVAEVMAATGWLPHTTRAALTGLRKRGYALNPRRRRRGPGVPHRYGPGRRGVSVMARIEADPTSLAGTVAALEALDLAQLRVRFRNHTGRIAPARLSRTLLLRVLAYRIQAKALGDLRPETRRMLARLAEASAVGRMTVRAGGAEVALAAKPHCRPAGAVRPSIPAHRPAPQLGTVLVREWQGAMEQVSVVGEGYSWRGATYPSLSAVALAITGTKWNGRRFFGLDRPAAKAGARP